ncbi:MAG: hypothetical protein WDZ35_10910 [Crocinitomicaceae bacterium]
MSKISNINELQARIIELQLQGKEEGVALKAELSFIIDNIHPIQLLTHGFKEIINSPEVKSELFSLSLGMSSGYVAKKLVIGKSENTLQHIAGNVLGMLVTKNVALHSDEIRSTTFSLLKSLFVKKKSQEEQEDTTN